MSIRLFNVTIFCFTLLFSAYAQKNSKSETSTTPESENHVTLVKLIPVVFGGNRYVVEADFGLESKVPLMVHGNASFYLMLTHEIAEKLNNGNPLEKIRDYGYSNKGMGNIHVQKFQLHDKTFTPQEKVVVFDWPEEEGKAAQGMLGIPFLKDEKVRIDFLKEQMEIGVEVNEQPDKSLINQGYSYTRFFIDNNKAYMNVFFEALQKEIPITVGTVSDEYSFDAVTFKNRMEMEAADSKANSPSRTSTPIFTNAAPIKYKIANLSFEINSRKADFYSFAEYQNIKQTDLFTFGIFGRDWMKENSAIIDYANRILYFKTQD
jgi:hypothetical protein